MKRMRQRKWPAAIALGAMLSAQSAAPLAYAGEKNHNGPSTTTPIKHLIVLIGENRSFDNVYGTYRSRSEDEHHSSVGNLLSRGIVNDNGSPGPNMALSSQNSENTPLPATYFTSSSNKTAYSPLPTPELNGAPNVQKPLGSSAPFDSTVSDAELQVLEPSLEIDDLGLLRTGATGAAATTGLDSRITNATNLSNTSFQITGPDLPYDSYTGDTVHRFYHMWQQSDCDVANATPTNPSGCLNDLYPFVGLARDDSGGNSLGFYNVQDGDAPAMKRLVDEYTPERQLSSVGDGRNCGESRGAWHWRRDLLDDLRRDDPAARVAGSRSDADLADLQAGTLPAVSFVKPDSYVDGHPASSKLGLFEAMLENIVDQMGDRKDTALFVAFDEGGGYWDSGYYQPLDFFGETDRVFLFWWSPLTRSVGRWCTPTRITFRS
jgi:hypothetical protein